MSRRGPRWRVHYILEHDGRHITTDWVVRARSEPEAIDAAREARAA